MVSSHQDGTGNKGLYANAWKLSHMGYGLFTLSVTGTGTKTLSGTRTMGTVGPDTCSI